MNQKCFFKSMNALIFLTLRKRRKLRKCLFFSRITNKEIVLNSSFV
jgi:hypothetical protein